MSRPRRFWIGTTIGAICWLIAVFTVGYAVGAHETTHSIAHSLNAATPTATGNTTTVPLVLYQVGDSYTVPGDYVLAGGLAVIGAVALILAARSGRRGRSESL